MSYKTCTERLGSGVSTLAQATGQPNLLLYLKYAAEIRNYLLHIIINIIRQHYHTSAILFFSHLVRAYGRPRCGRSPSRLAFEAPAAYRPTRPMTTSGEANGPEVTKNISSRSFSKKHKVRALRPYSQSRRANYRSAPHTTLKKNVLHHTTSGTSSRKREPTYFKQRRRSAFTSIRHRNTTVDHTKTAGARHLIRHNTRKNDTVQPRLSNTRTCTTSLLPQMACHTIDTSYTQQHTTGSTKKVINQKSNDKINKK